MLPTRDVVGRLVEDEVRDPLQRRVQVFSAGLVLRKPPAPRAEPGPDPEELTSAIRSGLPVAEPEKLRVPLVRVCERRGGSGASAPRGAAGRSLFDHRH
ncbi:hypothetical protein [Amycolatopsis sp. NPDC051071]|uniref:hypothetical protein n=1 Tax=Amycolatopsis sp. NPDC051071 TaxID=3154637 RepID=UPI003434AA74